MNFPPSPSKILIVGLGGIAVSPERLRALRPERVAEIAASMQESGLLQPIVLRTGKGNGYWLVAGKHRFEAAKLLKWDSIRACVYEDMEAVHAELAEIDENLIRADLSPAERALHVARRKELYEDKHGKAKAIGGSASQRKQGHKAKDNLADAFTTETAKKTGKSSRAVRRDAKRGETVTVLPDIVGTSLDKGDELDALAKLDPGEQQKLAERAKAGEKVSAKTAEFAKAVPTLDQQRLIVEHGSVAAAVQATVKTKADRAAQVMSRKVPDPKAAADRAEGRSRQHLDAEFEQRVRDECRKRIEETILPSYNKSHAEYQEVIKARKGVMDKKTFMLIWSCLHTDSRKSVSDEKLNEAFHLFSKMELRLLDEKEHPTPTIEMPRTNEELMALKRKVSEGRKADRKVESAS